MTFEVFKPRSIREREGDERLAAVTPMANGLIDAVRAEDAKWVSAVCRSVERGQVDWRALLVCLAAKAAHE